MIITRYRGTKIMARSAKEIINIILSLMGDAQFKEKNNG